MKQEILNFQSNVRENQEKVEILEGEIKEEQNLIELSKMTIKGYKAYILEATVKGSPTIESDINFSDFFIYRRRKKCLKRQ